ncbi:MAG: glycosyl hydrolase [Lachnospiraceae bacterium]|nr:glycosyl hydrolase [Lachnospiraceae bacterium]
MDILEKFRNPEKQYKPDVRWWLAEGLHTDETLKNDIKLLDESGFGAVEFLAMEEPGADSKIYGWGSEEWVHDSRLMFEETTKRDLGISATCGTNWSNCNLTTITPDDKAAAKELDYEVEILAPGESRSGKIKDCKLFMDGVTKQELIAVVAIKTGDEKDGKKYLDKESAVVLTDKVADGNLEWSAPADGTYCLFFFWIHGTGQTAAPSVSVSYTVNYIDHYGIDAFKEYWDNVVLTDGLKETIKKNGKAMMYMDSLELSTFAKGGQLWGYNFLKEFEARRGYDLTPLLPFIIKEPGMMQDDFTYYYRMEDGKYEEKLRNDLYQTMTDMYMENMMKPMQEWCHANNMILRSEISYGLPFEISQPGKYVDDIETESLEFCSQIESYRNLAGPAHIYDRLYSSETGATMLNYMMGLDFYTQIIFTQFAAGITKTVLHGYSSIAGSEESTQWPGHEGMWPIFSERFGVRQPAFQHYNDWTAMVARYQMLLRQGKPRMDLGILRLDYNFNNLIFGGENEKELYEHKLMRGHEGMYWKDMKLQDAGYTWDYFAPQILEEDFVDVGNKELLPDGPGYQALIIYQNVMPVKTAEKLLKLAKKGLPIIFVNGVTETIRPGGISKTHKKAAEITPFNDGNDTLLADLITQMKNLENVVEIDDQDKTCETLMSLGIKSRTEFTEPNENILTLTRQDGKVTFFYAYNKEYTQTENFTFKVAVAGRGKPYKIDCWNAEIEEVGCYETTNAATVLTITLAPGEACLYAIDTAEQEEYIKKAEGCSVTKKDGAYVVKVTESGKHVLTVSDDTCKEVEAVVPDSIELERWNLEVEDWNAGEKKVITEDRGLGIITKEVYYETTKDIISAGEITLKPWKDIPAIGPDVSGVGYYKTSFQTPADWDDSTGVVLKLGNANKNTVAVYVNGTKGRAVDFDALEVDITELVQPGVNEITVEVSSTLNNRLLARGYYDMVNELSKMLSDHANNAFEGGAAEEEEQPTGLSFDVQTSPQDYGLTDFARLDFYKKVVIK